MSSSNPAYRNPAHVIFTREETAPPAKSGQHSTASVDLPIASKFRFSIEGQGVVLFKLRDVAQLSKTGSAGYPVNIELQHFTNDDGFKFVAGAGWCKLYSVKLGIETLLGEKNTGLIADEDAFYWLSIDAGNGFIRFGIGEARVETETFLCQLNKEMKELCKEVARFNCDLSRVTPIRLLRDPIILPVSLYVKPMDQISMDDIAENTIMPKGNLNEIAQRLYENVAGEKFTLDTPDFPMFSAAIERSVADPKGWCYRKLKEKNSGYPADKKVYLRITLGKNSGESPGIPYVLEIWPPGCYSSRHSHAGANAIIRVLHGQVSVDLHRYLGKNAEKFGEALFSKDDITWISPALNQFHLLKNKNETGPTCITIQCYMYDATDTSHDPYFDYVNKEGKIESFDPNSDMDFVAFKNEMKKEWAAAHQ